MHRTLIVARLNDGAERTVADLFAASDATDLPQRIGVRSRTLFEFHGLYFHLIETDAEFRARVDEARRDPLFVNLSADLEPYVTPYDPQRWRSPVDAMARSFYHWDNPRRSQA
ncbi:TcmI family type II polyketide cyclase [Micromonospora carbonacea subsp. aurantiaca]|uniref:TcmI family type II polyketide cyclase n=1 Tax=Micromonospora carbonacea TaxID=47853 RepID=A0A7H8XU66_9ACTN|nr:TcmI family type II polyketide cyclase [Micromonospora carbonacea]QLD28606.1 TcmI family type II polyketide cyclase [Micromonospora carbonacea]